MDSSVCLGLWLKACSVSGWIASWIHSPGSLLPGFSWEQLSTSFLLIEVLLLLKVISRPPAPRCLPTLLQPTVLVTQNQHYLSDIVSHIFPSPAGWHIPESCHGALYHSQHSGIFWDQLKPDQRCPEKMLGLFPGSLNEGR